MIVCGYMGMYPQTSAGSAALRGGGGRGGALGYFSRPTVPDSVKPMDFDFASVPLSVPDRPNRPGRAA